MGDGIRLMVCTCIALMANQFFRSVSDCADFVFRLPRCFFLFAPLIRYDRPIVFQFNVNYGSASLEIASKNIGISFGTQMHLNSKSIHVH